MTKIAYLFGAGASANALPVVNKMPDRIKRMAENLPKTDDPKNSIQKVCNEGQLKCISDELCWLHGMIGDHTTVDALAKTLYIQNKYEDYTRLNYTLAAYLALEQLLGSPDKRYDTFWASLIEERDYDLPSNISILSWNYDSQFEITLPKYSRYGAEKLSLQLGLNYGEPQRANQSDGFSITKLNGTALLELNNPLLSQNVSLQKSVYYYVYEKYLSENKLWQGSFGPLQFAWSLSKKQMGSAGSAGIDEGYKSRICNKVSDAEILVVIGYSFPDFNRAIDRMIVENMPNLKKIYFQDPEPDKKANAFKSISNKVFETELISDTGHFFLPPEF
jgi:hypothetical protein